MHRLVPAAPSPPPSPGRSPGNLPFLSLEVTNSQGRGALAVKCPAVGLKVEGKCSAPQKPLNLWPDLKCTNFI